MRQRNVHYERGLPGCAFDGLPEHRRRVDHRRGFWGKIITADPNLPGTLLQVADRSDAFTPVHRNFRKVNNL
jgi:hypothetical protein